MFESKKLWVLACVGLVGMSDLGARDLKDACVAAKAPQARQVAPTINPAPVAPVVAAKSADVETKTETKAAAKTEVKAEEAKEVKAPRTRKARKVVVAKTQAEVGLLKWFRSWFGPKHAKTVKKPLTHKRTFRKNGKKVVGKTLVVSKRTKVQGRFKVHNRSAGLRQRKSASQVATPQVDALNAQIATLQKELQVVKAPASNVSNASLNTTAEAADLRHEIQAKKAQLAMLQGVVNAHLPLTPELVSNQTLVQSIGKVLQAPQQAQQTLNAAKAAEEQAAAALAAIHQDYLEKFETLQAAEIAHALAENNAEICAIELRLAEAVAVRENAFKAADAAVQTAEHKVREARQALDQARADARKAVVAEEAAAAEAATQAAVETALLTGSAATAAAVTEAGAIGLAQVVPCATGDHVTVETEVATQAVITIPIAQAEANLTQAREDQEAARNAADDAKQAAHAGFDQAFEKILAEKLAERARAAEIKRAQLQKAAGDLLSNYPRALQEVGPFQAELVKVLADLSRAKKEADLTKSAADWVQQVACIKSDAYKTYQSLFQRQLTSQPQQVQPVRG